MTTAVDRRTVIVVQDELPPGLAVNAASVLSVALGVRIPDLVGPDVRDADGCLHPGVVAAPLPILRADPATLSRITDTAVADDALFAAPFSSLAQNCRTYDEYVRSMADTPTSDLRTAALALVGPAKRVNRLVGSLALFR